MNHTNLQSFDFLFPKQLCIFFPHQLWVTVSSFVFHLNCNPHQDFSNNSYQPNVSRKGTRCFYKSNKLQRICQIFQSLEGKDWVSVTSAPLVLELCRGSTNTRCGQYGREAAHPATVLTSVFAGSLASSAGPEALPSSLTSWSWRSGWEPLPHPRSAAGNGECRRSWNRTSAQSRHSRHHCWHHRQNTSRRAHSASSQASSARSDEGWGWWRKKWKDEMTMSHPKQTHHQQRAACQKMHPGAVHHACLCLQLREEKQEGRFLVDMASNKQSTCSRERVWSLAHCVGSSGRQAWVIILLPPLRAAWVQKASGPFCFGSPPLR